MPTVFKSGSPNLLEPSGSVEACNGIALPLPFLLPVDTAQQHRRIQPSGTPPRRIAQYYYCCLLWFICDAVNDISIIYLEGLRKIEKTSNIRAEDRIKRPLIRLPLAADITVSSPSVILLSTSSLQTPAAHCGVPGSIPGQSMWNLR